MGCIWCHNASNVEEIRIGCGSYVCRDVSACNSRSSA